MSEIQKCTRAKRMVRPDILRWQPPRWELFLGNKRIIKHFKRVVQTLRGQNADDTHVDLNRLCFLLLGQSRSGKTALVRFLVRCLSCREFDIETLNPCTGHCPVCKQQPDLWGLEGLHSEFLVGGDEIPVHFAIVDCTMIATPIQLQERLVSLSSYRGLRIYYFDEIHRLAKRGMDEMLLKAIEDKNFVWLFSTAKPAGLEDMFQNRLLKFRTEPPTAEDMELWLADRCDEWGIRWEAAAVVRVAQKSNLVVGTALHALALASLCPDEGLTLDLVENDWLVRLDD